ncbi:MAG: sensor histidine kinase [Frankiales bacterium]|nr:sensor histidine kinase [Frankiales bacterium]
MPRERARRGRFGVRLSATLAATAVVAAAFAISGVLLVALVRHSLLANLDAAGTARARDVAALATANRLQGTVASTSEESSVAQLVSPSRVVVAASSNIQGEAPLVSPPSPRRLVSFTSAGLPIGDPNDRFRVVAEPVTLAQGPGWVYVATSLRQTDTTIARLVILLATGLPLLLLLVAAVIWLAVGRALRPVEQIRTRAATIGATELGQRVPVPRSRDEVARLASTMNEMLQRLEAAALRQRRFVGDASHELRSPLSALQAQIDVALAYPDPARQQQALPRIRLQAARMAELIDDLLFLARADEGRLKGNRTRVDLDELVLAEARRLSATGKGRIEVVGPDATAVTGSERDLTRMLRNLGDNALTHANSTVTFGLTCEDGTAVLSVTDDGPGIPLQDRARIFERFTRLEEGRPRQPAGGTGLGLAITKQIVRSHGGQICVGSRRDGRPGAVFVVTIPLQGRAPS